MDRSMVFAYTINSLVFQKKSSQLIFYPIIIYLFIALILNFFADLIWQAPHLHIKFPTDNNNPLYNLHSIMRMFLFSWFFIKLDQPFIPFIKKLIPFFLFYFSSSEFSFFLTTF